MILNEVMKETADAIREKTGKSELIKPVDFATEIKGITVGGGSAEETYTYYKAPEGGLKVLGDLIGTSLIKLKLEADGYGYTAISPLADSFVLGDWNQTMVRAVAVSSKPQYFKVKFNIDGTTTEMNSVEELFAMNGIDYVWKNWEQLTKEEFYDLNASLTPQEITFTVSGVEYTALSGMTWEEFCNSEYNDGGWGKLFFDCEALGDGKISASDSGMDAGIVQLNGSNVYKTDAIQPNANYTTSNPLG